MEAVTPLVERYLDKVLAIADLRDPARESGIRQELRGHIQEKTEALKASGADPAEALVKAVEDHGNPLLIGYQLRTWRLIDVRLRGTARGVIAIGPRAIGVVAIGGVAMGLIAFGGLAVGLFGFGGLALGLLLAWGGCAVGGVAYGGLAVGALAFGGMSVGVVAIGGSAGGLWVPSAGHTWFSHYTLQSVPALLRQIGEMVALDPRTEVGRAHFKSFMAFSNVFTLVVLFVMITAQNVLLGRERRRLETTAPGVAGIGSHVG